jgi:hypothetical protein
LLRPTIFRNKRGRYLGGHTAHFFLQASNQFLQAPVTLGLPFELHVALHLSPIPHCPHIVVHETQILPSSLALADWAMAGNEAVRKTIATAPKVKALSIVPPCLFLWRHLKLGHPKNQIRPLRVKTGQHRTTELDF